jgi:hypothetical protein
MAHGVDAPLRGQKSAASDVTFDMAGRVPKLRQLSQGHHAVLAPRQGCQPGGFFT